MRKGRAVVIPCHPTGTMHRHAACMAPQAIAPGIVPNAVVLSCVLLCGAAHGRMHARSQVPVHFVLF